MPLIKYNGKTYAGSDVDLKDKVVTFESGDGLEPTGPADVPLMESGGRVKNLMRSISLAVRNTRYLLKVLGTTDISALADGTLTGAVKGLSDGKLDKAGGAVSGILNLRNGYIVGTGHSIGETPKWVEIMTITPASGYANGTIAFGVLNRNIPVPIEASIKVWASSGKAAIGNFYIAEPTNSTAVDLAAVVEGATARVYIHTTWYDNIVISHLHNMHGSTVIDTSVSSSLDTLPEGAVMAKRRGISITGDVTGTSAFDAATGNTVIQAKVDALATTDIQIDDFLYSYSGLLKPKVFGISKSGNAIMFYLQFEPLVDISGMTDVAYVVSEYRPASQYVYVAFFDNVNGATKVVGNAYLRKNGSLVLRPFKGITAQTGYIFEFYMCYLTS